LDLALQRIGLAVRIQLLVTQARGSHKSNVYRVMMCLSIQGEVVGNFHQAKSKLTA
tara:strand:- start:1222 stop:1389 length:168 start_codon:yes stop_codon:yes gene_type:complete